MVDKDRIPVTYEGKVVGYTYSEGGSLTITDEEFQKKFEKLSNGPIGISSRGYGIINDDGTIERNEPFEFSIIKIQKDGISN